MNYKQINENWQRYLTEAEPEVNNVGELKELIQSAMSKGVEKRGKKHLKDIGLSAIAGAFGLGAVKSAYDAYKALYGATDTAKKGTGLDYLNVDDKVGAIVDDAVETAFLKGWLEKLDKEDDETSLENYDVNKGLADFIKDTGKLPAAGPPTAPTVRDFAE